MAYDYAKLNGRIIEKCGTRRNFAKLMKMSEASLSNKLNGKFLFSQDEISLAISILQIPVDDLTDYFFKEKVAN